MRQRDIRRYSLEAALTLTSPDVPGTMDPLHVLRNAKAIEEYVEKGTLPNILGDAVKAVIAGQ